MVFMGLPLPVSPSVPLVGVDGLLGRLSARERAQLVWIRKPMLDALGRLHQEPLSRGLVDEVARQVWPLLVPLLGALLTMPEQVMAEVERQNDQEREKLRDFLAGDSDALRALDDVIEGIRSLAHGVRYLSGLGPWLTPGVAGQAMGDPEFKEWVGGIVALMAASEGMRTGVDREVVALLLMQASLDIGSFYEGARAALPWLPAFPPIPLAEQKGRLLESARRLRELLTDEDLVLLQEGWRRGGE